MRQNNWKSLFRTWTVSQIQQEVADIEHSSQVKMTKTLGVWDLTLFGVAAIIGAGIFSTIGNAVSNGGPGVVFLFIFTAIACALSALCYAEFASAIPIAGSAYTYAYASFGEIIAWIIGWDLLMEYAISNIAVAISWSDYFGALLAGYGIHIPNYLRIDFLSAYRGFHQAQDLLIQGKTWIEINAMDTSLIKAHQAWTEAPHLLSLPLVLNFPALVITLVVTGVAYIGIQESKITSNFFVLIKVAVILLVITLGSFYVHPTYWTPFFPHGFSGVFQGVSAVFFAYIGFDAISTTAEECKNPQRDIPKAMLFSLTICTALYVLVSIVLTGMMPYHKLAVGDPLAFAFGPEGANLPWVSGIISISAVISLFTVLLVYQLGQPRIWMAMSRDGLLPPIFSEIHPKYKTPWFSTILTGLFVAIPSLFLNLTEVTNLASIGTLFAFALVCGGVLLLNQKGPNPNQKFRITYISSKYIFPALTLVCFVAAFWFNKNEMNTILSLHQWDDKIPYLIFGSSMVVLSVYCFTRNLSLIPVLGLSSCCYLITELGIANWIRFGAWLVVGLCIYFCYGAKHSRLKQILEKQ